MFKAATAALLASAHAAHAAPLSFMAIGDWGGVGYSPYTTPAQVKAAAGMNKVAGEIGSQFVLALGDNFYSDGVTNVASSRFAATWENVYIKNKPNLETKWYVIGGNHDHYGNITAQVAYTSQSDYWTFPNAYHSKSFTGEDGTTVDIILIDTVELAGMNAVQSEGEAGYFSPLPMRSRRLANSQWTWIEDQMKASTADYLLVGGHYPVYSVCEHGPTSNLISNLKPLLQKYGAHYFSGHDHCMEHLEESNVNYIVSGMGDECCYKASNSGKVPANSLKWKMSHEVQPDSVVSGFTSVVLSKSAMTVKYYDQDGNVLFTAPAISPRASTNNSLRH